MRAAAAFAAVVWGAAGDSTWQAKQCPQVTLASWADPKCWTPSPPGEAGTAVFPAGAAVTVNTSKTNVTVDAIVVAGISIEKGAAVTLVEGTFELRGPAAVAGTLSVHGKGGPLAKGTDNTAALQVDAKARALGLRDCAYTPAGFTPRLCGSGTWTVTDGGLIDLQGHYASVFSAVHVLKGGTYRMSNGAHPWGAVTNEGMVTTEPTGVCDIPSSGRSQCRGHSADECDSLGCCWDPPADLCANKGTSSCANYYNAGMDKSACNARGCCFQQVQCADASKWGWQKSSCGAKGVTAEGCAASGCCWNATDKNMPCFYKYTDPPCTDSNPPSCFAKKGSGTVYWHGMLNNKQGATFRQFGTMFFDEYTRDVGDGTNTPEHFTQDPFINQGEMMIGGNLYSTRFYYGFGASPASGVYASSFTNLPGGRITVTGRVDGANITNQGTWDNQGKLYSDIDNSGTVQNSGSIYAAHFNNMATYTGKGPVGQSGKCTLKNSGGGMANITASAGQYDDEVNGCQIVNSAVLILSGTITSGATYSITNAAGGRFNIIPGSSGYYGAGLILAELANMGDVLVDATSVWVNKATCVNCHYFLSRGAELHLQNPGVGRAPRGLLADLGDSRGTPKICTDGACASDPCPYAVDDSVGRKVCQTATTPPGPGVEAYGVCYACDPARHPLGLLNDRSAIDRLVGEARQNGGGGGTAARPRGAPSSAELARRLYHFEGGVVNGDGTGALVLTGAVHLHGQQALRVRDCRVHSVLEWGLPVFVGGGRLTLRKGSALRLGVEAVLDDGGSITAESGAAVVVDAHATVDARNHSFLIAPRATVRVDGRLTVGSRSTLRHCGASIGSGIVHFADPAASSLDCAAPRAGSAKCLSECSTDADCSGAGSCTWCSKGHGGSATTGACTEPLPHGACKNDADCSLSGNCVGGACVNCDSKSYPRTGHDCAALQLRENTGLWKDFVDPQTGNVTSGDVVGGFNHGGFGQYWYATVSPKHCKAGGPDDMIGTTAPRVNNKLYGHLVLQQAQNLAMLHNAPGAYEQPVYFDYTWPRTDSCSWNYSVCAGTCPGGGKCGFTSAADCGCPAQCAPRNSSASQCGTRISTAVSARTLGDCGPHDRCWCGRDGKQNVVGTKGCPSSPRAVQPDAANGTVLMFYNMGDGINIGLAEGPFEGPWQVVKEPLFPAGTDAVQDPFVYKDHYGWHMLLTGVAQKTVRAAFSEDGKSWTLLPKPLIDLKTEANGPLFTQVSRPRVYTEGQWSYQWDHKLTYNGRCYKVFIDGKTSDKAAVRPYWWQVCSDSR
eukprot:TRINITY_DN1510_c0_g2_i2.p1 TRINITY_DN1510_c0_g2~~TRINITY_DN1510_c0_g2_i2.p1  ORF type:complete len:1320 (+),score=390.55 TRINITY_DN1510_c0_g2_i2:80-3961(+)